MSDFVSVVSWDHVLETLVNPNEAVSIIVAPNFEERSNAFLQGFCARIIDHDLNNRWQIITLQGPNEYDARDYMKARNCNRAYEALLLAGLREGKDVFLTRMMNPTTDEDLRSLLGKATDGMESEFSLIIDISAIPRAFLWRVLAALSPSEHGPLGFKLPKRIWLVYAWAKDYSSSLEFETTGRIVDLISARSLAEVIQRSESIDAAVFTSGNTRNAFMLVDAFSSIAHSRDFSLELVHFIRPTGFNRSWHHLRLHQDLLARNVPTDRMNNSFVFHIAHTLAWLRTLADKAFNRLKERGNHSFLIAPNGPKIISVLAKLVADEYIARIINDVELLNVIGNRGISPKDCVSILLSQGSQFLSIYSLGIDGEISCCEVLRPNAQHVRV